MAKIFGKRSIRVIVTIVLFGASMSVKAQSSQPNLSDNLVRYIGFYVFNSPKCKPPGFEKIRWIRIDVRPGEDEDDPKVENGNVTRIDGYVETIDDERFKFKRALLKKNGEGNYETLEFDTETMNGIHFEFNGAFLRKSVNEGGEYTALRGSLFKYKNGESAASVIRAPFSKYAIE